MIQLVTPKFQSCYEKRWSILLEQIPDAFGRF